MPSDIHEAANTTKEGWIAWFCPLKLYRHYSGCRIWSGLLYRNYIKLYVSFCAARPGFVAYLFVVQYTTAVLYRCFYIRFVLPPHTCRFIHLRWGFFSFFTVSDLRRILFSGGWFHDLLPQSFFSLFILLSTDCRTFTHNPGNIGKNPGLSPDCHLSYLLPALTIYVYIWL